MNSRSATLIVVSLVVAAAAVCTVAAAPVPASSSSKRIHTHRNTGGRKLKQLTIYASTPALASSTSAALNGNAQIGPEGTLHGVGGVAATTSTALSNPLLQALTLSGYNNRPEAATATYVSSPLSLGV